MKAVRCSNRNPPMVFGTRMHLLPPEFWNSTKQRLLQASLDNIRGVAVGWSGSHEWLNPQASTSAPKSSTSCAASSAAIPAASSSQQQTGNNGTEETLSMQLDWQCKLSLTQNMLCFGGAAAVCALLYCVTAPSRPPLKYLTALAALFGALTYMFRSKVVEDMYLARCRAEADLGDTDSRFHAISNLRVHVKTNVAEQLHLPAPAAHGDNGSSNSTTATALHQSANSTASVTAVHCYHGFGANLYSFSLVQNMLAQQLRGVVTSHDMPGFGLTERPKDVRQYFLASNGRLGRLVMDYELQQLGLAQEQHARKPTSKQAQQVTSQGHMLRAQPAGLQGSASALTMFAPAVDATATDAPDKHPGSDHSDSGDISLDNSGRSSDSEDTVVLQLGSPASVLGRGVSSQMKGPGQKGSTTVTMRLSSSTATLPDANISAANKPKANSSQPSFYHSTAPTPQIKRVLLGHSLGGACAALEACSNPSGVSALVLVAPAILAMPGSEYSKVTLEMQPTPKGSFADVASVGASGKDVSSWADSQAIINAASYDGGNQNSTTASNGTQQKLQPQIIRRYIASGSVSFATPSTATRTTLLVRVVLSLIKALSIAGTLFVLKLLQPAITLLLRSLVRSRSFWQKGLQQAYYDGSRVTDRILDSYRLPQLVRGWEAGLNMFLVARLTQTQDLLSSVRQALSELLRGPKVSASNHKGKHSSSANAADSATPNSASATTQSVPVADNPAANSASGPQLASPEQATADLRSNSAAGAQPASVDTAAADSNTISAAASSVQDVASTSSSHQAGTETELDAASSDSDIARRLAHLVHKHGIRVIIIHGEYDKLVPASNSTRLARMLPGCELVLLDRCGHMPQEEWPELFVDVVRDFVERVS